MTRFDFPKLGNCLRTAAHRQGTPGVEDATARRIDWTRHLPFYDFVRSFGLHRRVRNRDGGKQGTSVGVNGVVVKLVALCKLNYMAQIHHRDALAKVPNDAEIVGNKQICQPEFVAKVFQKVNDLGLN